MENLTGRTVASHTELKRRLETGREDQAMASNEGGLGMGRPAMMCAHLAHLATALLPTVARPSLLRPGALACMYVARHRQGPGARGHPPRDREQDGQSWGPRDTVS